MTTIIPTDIMKFISLKSTDGVSFVVDVAMLSQVSTVFRHMFDFPYILHDVSTMPEVQLTEESQALGMVISFLVDGQATCGLSPGDFRSLATVLTVCDKYDMQIGASKVSKYITDHWHSFQSSPLHLFAFIANNGLENLRGLGFMETLTLDIFDHDNQSLLRSLLSESDRITLQTKHKSRKATMKALFRHGLLFITDGCKGGCDYGDESVGIYEEVVRDVDARIDRRPLAEFLFDSSFWTDGIGNTGMLSIKCPSCATYVFGKRTPPFFYEDKFEDSFFI